MLNANPGRQKYGYAINLSKWTTRKLARQLEIGFMTKVLSKKLIALIHATLHASILIMNHKSKTFDRSGSFIYSNITYAATINVSYTVFVSDASSIRAYIQPGVVHCALLFRLNFACTIKSVEIQNQSVNFLSYFFYFFLSSIFQCLVLLFWDYWLLFGSSGLAHFQRIKLILMDICGFSYMLFKIMDTCYMVCWIAIVCFRIVY